MATAPSSPADAQDHSSFSLPASIERGAARVSERVHYSMGRVKSTLSEKISATAARIREMVIPALWIVAATFLCLTFPQFFFIGGIFAALKPKLMHSSIERLSCVWKDMNWQCRTLLVVGAWKALSVYLLFASVFAGAKVSLIFQKYDPSNDDSSQSSEEHQRPPATPHTGPHTPMSIDDLSS